MGRGLGVCEGRPVGLGWTPEGVGTEGVPEGRRPEEEGAEDDVGVGTGGGVCEGPPNAAAATMGSAMGPATAGAPTAWRLLWTSAGTAYAASTNRISAARAWRILEFAMLVDACELFRVVY